MKWSDVTKTPTLKMLRQFAALSLAVFGGAAAWRLAHGTQDAWTYALATLAVVIGVGGLIAPAMVGPVFRAWMIAAFPIGWLVSRIVLALMFYLLFVPVALLFRAVGRDLLQLRRPSRASYWMAKPGARSGAEYLRQF